MLENTASKHLLSALMLGSAFLVSTAHSQALLRNATLENFRSVEGWSAVAEVTAVADKSEFVTAGHGPILVNGTAKDKTSPYLTTKSEYGDVRIEMEFMVPKNSNAGVYLMGRYEVQFLDSFGRQRMGFGDHGGIYHRWDPGQPQGKQGYESIAPKTNAAKPAGEWQTLDITFRAPRFDPSGKKTSDATFEKVLVNDVFVQENASVTGPTQSSPFEGVAALGPIAIQGDHGPIAIRNFRVSPLE